MQLTYALDYIQFAILAVLDYKVFYEYTAISSIFEFS